MPTAYKYRLTVLHEADSYDVNTVDVQDESYELQILLGNYIKGDPGNGITNIVTNADGTLTIVLEDGTSYTTQPLVGPQGPEGAPGPQGPAGPGVPTGGTAGQVLSKVDDTDYNTQWTTPQGGGGISTLNIPVIPDLGEYNLGTKAQAATVLGITEAELDALMGGNYDRLVFENSMYADRTEAVHTYQSNVSVSYSYTGRNPLRFVFSTDGVEYFSLAERIVPALSTSISDDGSSNTKAATPKAVKDYVDDLPIPRLLRLGAFTPTESSSYMSLGNASAAAASLNIEEEELYNLYDGAYNRLVMYDIATGKERIAHDALRIDEGGGATYEILAPDGTPYILDFLYESSAFKYRYYSVVGDIATILASI